MKVLFAILLASIMLVSGCISGNGDTETTTPAPTTTAAPTTVAPPPEGIRAPVQIGAVEWTYYDYAVEAAMEEDTHIFFYFWRDPCPFCDNMRELLADPDVSEFINANFKSVEVDIWSHEPMSEASSSVTGAALGSTFHLMGAPSMGFVNSRGEIVYVVPGYKEKTEFTYILMYVNSGSYTDMSFTEYVKSFQQ